MATELVPFTTDNDESAVQTVGAGEVHTLIPVFNGRSGAVEIYAVRADDELTHLARLSTRPSSNKLWQINGPIEYVVKVRNAGCDVDVGA